MENLKIQELYNKGNRAYWAIADFTQDQIDIMLGKMAKIVHDHAEELGQMAYEECEMGTADDYIGYMKIFPLCYWSYMKGKKSFGMIDDNPQTKIQTYGKAMGVVACLTPSTTNISNGFEISMKAVKSGNAIIIAPHPRAWKASKRLAEYLQVAIKSAGGPDNLVQSIENPSLEDTTDLMAICDVVVGTGGASMVKAAYSSGTPAFGVGQGNVPVVVSATYPADEVLNVVKTILSDRYSGGGVGCTCPQIVFLPRSRKDEFMKLFAENGAYIVEDGEVIDRIREVVFPDGGRRINREVVGQSAQVLAKMYGLTIPEGTNTIMLKLKDGVRAGEDVLNQEIMNPTLRYQFYDDFAKATEIARANLFYEGAGHSTQLWSYEQKEIDLYARRIPVVRLLIRQGAIGAANITLQNGIAPSTTVGCGTWGGNSFSDNLDYTTLQNHTLVLYPLNDGSIPTAEECFADVEI